MSTATAVTATVSDGLGVAAGLLQAWERLFLARPNEPSTSPEWTLALSRHHLRADDRAVLVQLHRGESLVGIVPLVCRVLKVLGQPVRLLTPLSEQYNTHSDLLLADHADDTVSAFVSTVLQLGIRWDCFRMARLLEENPLLPALRRGFERQGRTFAMRDGLPAYVLELPDSFEQYLAGRSAKFRSHLKRVTRKLHDAGRVVVHHVDGAAQPEEAFGALLEIERASWKQLHGTAITAVDHQEAFFEDLARAASAAGRLHLQWLTIDGRPVAYNLGYLTTGGYHYLKTSYAHDQRPLSPATFLRAHLIQSLVAQGIRRVDFPGEPYAWEAQWTDTVRWRTVFSAFSTTWRGRALSVVDRVRRRSRTTERHVVHVDPRAQRPGPGRG